MYGGEARDRDSDEGCNFTCLGPLTKDAILQMATLTGDFHPLAVMDCVAKDAGYSEVILHPAWISGLVDVALRRAFPGYKVKYVSIEYDSNTVRTDRLSVGVEEKESERNAKEIRVCFQVKNQNNTIVAKGETRLVQPKPDDKMSPLSEPLHEINKT